MIEFESEGNPGHKEDEQERIAFNQMLRCCLQDYPQTRRRPLPVLVSQGRYLELYDLDAHVRLLGGYGMVTRENKWGAVAVSLKLEASNGACLKLVYSKYLKLFEVWIRRVRNKTSSSSCSDEKIDMKCVLNWIKRAAVVPEFEADRVDHLWLRQCLLRIREIITKSPPPGIEQKSCPNYGEKNAAACKPGRSGMSVSPLTSVPMCSSHEEENVRSVPLFCFGNLSEFNNVDANLGPSKIQAAHATISIPRKRVRSGPK